VTTGRRRGALARAGSVDDFEADRFRVIELRGRSIGVVRTERGFFALRNRCPHQGAELCAGLVAGTMEPSLPHQYEYSPEHLVVVCPWHRWEFELATGRAVGGISTKRAITYPVEVVEGEVYVELPGGAADG
jgi:nitrite reductase (NADH) small subunit